MSNTGVYSIFYLRVSNEPNDVCFRLRTALRSLMNSISEPQLNRMGELLGDEICCIPCKDLSHVKNPTAVGLGDAFAGGLLPGLLKEN